MCFVIPVFLLKHGSAVKCCAENLCDKIINNLEASLVITVCMNTLQERLDLQDNTGPPAREGGLC